MEAQAASTFSGPTIGCRLVLLGDHGRQSPHGCREALAGEAALLPPMLGSSQHLTNGSHHDVYYKVLQGITRHDKVSRGITRYVRV